uniref:Phospholipase A(2) n=1 Tax=Parastrongyloides trichosuri TaxID=131310 RepID=A0A0N4ZRT4_PARTI
MVIILFNFPLRCDQYNKTWECGNNFLSKFLALKSAYISCTKNQYLKINDCCQIHDNCYDKKEISKEQCDFNLEKCFDEAVSLENGLKKLTCKTLVSTFEIAVEIFGNKSYINSS